MSLPKVNLHSVDFEEYFSTTAAASDEAYYVVNSVKVNSTQIHFLETYNNCDVAFIHHFIGKEIGIEVDATFRTAFEFLIHVLNDFRNPSL